MTTQNSNQTTPSNDSPYKLTLYIDTPALMLRPGRNLVEHSQISNLVKHGRPTCLPITGHAFIGLTDETGKEERWGYTTASDDISIGAFIRGTPGAFVDEKDNKKYNEAIVYAVTKEQFLAAQKKAAEFQKDAGTYKLFEKNCSTVAVEILDAAGVDKRPAKALGLTPYGLAFKKRLMLAQRRCEAVLFHAKNTIKSLFGKKKAPRAELLESLRSKPVPVPVRDGTRTAKKGNMTPIDVNKIVSKIARSRF